MCLRHFAQIPHALTLPANPVCSGGSRNGSRCFTGTVTHSTCRREQQGLQSRMRAGIRRLSTMAGSSGYSSILTRLLRASGGWLRTVAMNWFRASMFRARTSCSQITGGTLLICAGTARSCSMGLRMDMGFLVKRCFVFIWVFDISRCSDQNFYYTART